MKKIFLLGLLITATLFLCAQRVDYIINLDEVERIEKTLASDEMQNQYDRETNHSINRKKQAEWLVYIDELLEEYADYATYN